jgi:site-specific DNA recombinase
MSKRAVIYIRVSSEKQSDRVSPETQEADGRAYCETHGWQVVAVYRDIKKYRVGKRLVEPSGERADRPGLKRMLADAYAGKFDVIVAWREDRLYRGYRPMLDVLDCIKETKIDIELVKEHFDKNIAPVKAWAARMELDAKHDRFMMGVAGRLAKGKPLNHPPPYGYKAVDGFYEKESDEAHWVQKIYEWYADEMSMKEIRHRLITGGAKQRRKVKRPWAYTTLRRILHEKDYYYTGVQIVHWDGEEYEIPIPPIVELELAKRVQQRRARYKVYPAGNVKHHCLAAGLVYCAACDARLLARIMKNGYKRKDGTEGKREVYRCHNHRYKKPGCVNRKSARKIDTEIWRKVWTLISEPDRFEQALQGRIATLQAEEEDAETECKRLNGQLDELLLERQKVITWARKGIITDDDLETQLMVLTAQENELKSTLSEKQVLVGNRAERLIKLASLFREQVQAGVEAINAEPETPEQAKRQLEFRRRIVRAIVKRVDVYKDLRVEVQAELELPNAVVNINDHLTPHRGGARAGVGRRTNPGIS